MTSARAKPFLLLGAGGHARVLLHMLPPGRVLGCLDADRALWGRTVGGVKVLGGDELAAAHAPGSVRLVNAVGAVKDVAARRRLFLEHSSRGHAFPALTAPSAHVAPDVSLGAGAQILTRAVVHPNARIGRNAVINTAAIVEHDCVVGDHAFVGPGAVVCGGCEIGEDAFLGAGSVLYPGVRIGRGARVAAGVVVRKNIPAGATAR